MKKSLGLTMGLSLGLHVQVAEALGGIGDMISDQVSSQISRTTSNAISKNLTESIFIPQLKIKNASGSVNAFAVSTDNRLLAVRHADGSLRVWDTQTGVQRPGLPLADNASHLLISSTADTAIIAKSDGSIVLIELATGKPLQQLSQTHSPITALSLSNDEQRLWAAHSDGSVIEWNLATFTVQKTLNTCYDKRVTAIRWLGGATNQLILAGEGGFTHRWDLATGSKIGELPNREESITGLALNAGGDVLIAVDKQGGLQAINLNTQQSLWDKQVIDDVVGGIAIDNSASLAAGQDDDNQLIVYDLNRQAIKQTLPFNEPLTQLQFITGTGLLAGADSQGVLHVFDSNKALEILKLISTNNGWTVIDQQGRFDSSEKAMANVSWQASDKDIALDSFSQNYYEPGLLGNYVQNRPFINRDPKAVQAGITLPPEIKFSETPTADANVGQPYTVSIEALDMAGGIAAIKLYHNGKVVPQTQQIDSRKSDDNGREKQQVRYQITPTAGDNSFKAVATNTMGIEGVSNEMHLVFTGSDKPSTLHILTVGINRYKDPQLNLTYSIPDAQAISNILTRKDLAHADKIHAVSLTDQKASKQAILDSLNGLAAYPQDDMLAVYLAGHGLAINGDWYFMPYETTAQSSPGAYAAIGISASEIREALAATHIQKILILIDSCYSGAGIDAFRNLQNSQRHFSRDLSKSNGIVVLTATRQDQEAAEVRDLGHGLFTYVVKQGMEGKADFKPRDTHISAHEVADYSLESIPNFSRKYLRATQEPSAFTLGKDFTLLGGSRP